MRRKKHTKLLMLIPLTLAVAFSLPLLRSQGQAPAASAPKQEEATLIQDGVMTDRQKKHSKLFKGYETVTKGKKLRELVAETGDVNIHRLVGDKRIPEDFDLNAYLLSSAQKADAIVIGEVRGKSSQIIEEGTFVFTEHELVIEEVLKDNPTNSIRTGDIVTVLRRGGAVQLNGHQVRTIDYAQKPLERGAKYLLFLRFIPDTGAYTSSGNNLADDSFQLRANKIIQASDQPLPFGGRVEVEAESFLGAVRAAIKKACGDGGGANR